ncbi:MULTISPECIES: hypothetical protein [unclassified Streptomyces]|uniref:hypothetical protein n=1 Tax=unclassified Streptomyces TaxID=2593676 RepID=UPI0037029940
MREMLTYLSSALPRFSSPAARLLALQCALRADSRGRLTLPPGFLRGMRLHQRGEVWHELEHAGWLCLPARRPTLLTVQVLDEAVLAQAPGRASRLHAAQWALRPVPLAVSGRAPWAMRLAALVVAAHTSATAGSADLDVLIRVCGQAPHQMADLLDHLCRARLLSVWRHDRHTDEISWLLIEHDEHDRR